MKRFFSLLGADIRFQLRYGFYGVYLVLSLMYAAVVRLVPETWREAVRALTVYTDPAALGFFFIGAIVLFEKGERVLSALAVTPVSAAEYALSKVLSLALISLASAVGIQLAGNGAVSISFLAGVFSGSCLYTALGLAVATGSPTVNAFFVRSIPLGFLVFTTGPLSWFGLMPPWLSWNPGSLLLSLLAPRGEARSFAAQAMLLAALLAWLVPVYLFAVRHSESLFTAEALDDRTGGIP